MNDEEQHGNIVDGVFWFFVVIIIAIVAVVFLGGPG